ncbi:RnfABCDGE type electron transport complex subunit D [Candidatus Haliotispira prima]|uniref:Ion-translocating oxidoreductase complex subunit D n=1 Tax=Candidatus Haliotispira prima TaxID=3034016 RepID=A0ABY8ME06_9SPIO|nr:RnfABCDGE type electron transport complex subunit D [Candidatus Haliotispira prima]
MEPHKPGDDTHARGARNPKENKGPSLPRGVFSSPHIFTGRSSARIMWLVSLCLLPAALWAVWLYGWPALRVLLLSILSCAGTEALLKLLTGRENRLYQDRPRKIIWTLDDGSAVLSGLLLGMNLSPSVAWYIPVFGGIFAMAVCKWSFGGLGANWVNPALAGRAFLFFSFGREMAHWSPPHRVWRHGGLQNFDADTVASPLTVFKEELLRARSGEPAPAPDAGVGSALQSWGEAMHLQDLQDLQGLQGGQDPVHQGQSLLNLLYGFHSGSIGESAALILLGGLFLWALRIISWHIPLAFLGSFALLTWVFGGLYQGLGLFSGEVLFHLLSGGIMLGAWFMATDYPGCPKMPAGKLIFGLGCGGLTFLIRFYGSYPEGVMLAILFMNIWTPTLDILIQPRIFGSGRLGSKRAGSGQKKAVRRNRLRLPGY